MAAAENVLVHILKTLVGYKCHADLTVFFSIAFHR